MKLFAPSNIIYEKSLTVNGVTKMEYMTPSQAAEKWNISQRRVQILCAQNRIEGVFKLGENWAIPANTEKPKDKRRKVDANETA